MAELITKSALFNGFAMWREILKGVTALTSANSKFASNEYYFDFDPLFRGRNFRQFPFVFIEDGFGDEPVVLDGSFRTFKHSSTIHLTLEKLARTNLRSYATHIMSYLQQNRDTLKGTYGLDDVRCEEAVYDDFEADNKQCVRISMSFTFMIDIDVENA